MFSSPLSCLVLGHVVLLPLRIEVTRANTRVGFLVQLVCKDSRKLVAISIKPESLILAKHIHFLFFSTTK